METRAPKSMDRRIEEVVAGLLRVGVSLSALTVICGGVAYLARYGFSPADYRTFRGEPDELKHVHGILAAAGAGNARAIIQLGLLILIATPVARVAFSIWGFAVERDRMYTIFTAVVLTILLSSLIGSSH